MVCHVRFSLCTLTSLSSAERLPIRIAIIKKLSIFSLSRLLRTQKAVLASTMGTVAKTSHLKWISVFETFLRLFQFAENVLCRVSSPGGTGVGEVVVSLFPPPPSTAKRACWQTALLPPRPPKMFSLNISDHFRTTIVLGLYSFVCL